MYTSLLLYSLVFDPNYEIAIDKTGQNSVKLTIGLFSLRSNCLAPVQPAARDINVHPFLSQLNKFTKENRRHGG